jgi:hypothetical protein
LDVYVKLTKDGKNILLAICDANLLGRTLKEGKIVFKITNEFYKGRKISIDQAVTLIENSTIVNLVGNSCVEKAIENGFVHPEAVLKIDGISHAQIIKL